MVGTVGEAQKNWRLFLDYSAAREDWAKEAAQNEDFFYGVQWSEKEIKVLEKRGMAPLVINRTMPVIQQEMAMFLAKRPTFRYFGVDDESDTATAKVFSDAAQHVWHISNGDSEYQQTMQDYFVVGAGYILVYIDPHADEGRGEVVFKSLPPWDVYPDPNSRNIDLSDARYIIVSRLIDKDTLKFMYPEKAQVIEKASPEQGEVVEKPDGNPNNTLASSISKVTYTGSLEQNDKVRIIERYEKVREKRYKIFDATRGVAFKTDDLTPEMEERMRDPASRLRVMEIWETRVKVTVTLGEYHHMETYRLRTPILPVIPFFLHHRRNPYPVGDVAIIKGLQQETNKRRSISIYNATLSGNTRFLAPKGSIPDKADFEERGASPGYILEFNDLGGQPPVPIQPQQLPAAFYQLELEAKNDIEYALSIFSHMMGSNVDAPETYRGMLALEERGQQKIQYKARHARLALRNLGMVVMHLIQQTYSPQKMLRVVGEGNEEARRVVANEMAVDQFTGEVRTFNDLSIGSYDLVVVDGTSMPTNKMALSQQMVDYYQLGLVDKEAVLKTLDIPDREQMIARMGEVAQMAGQLEQMQEAMKDLEGLNQTMRRQLQQAEIHAGAAKVMQGIKEQGIITANAEELARDKIKNDIALMREKLKMIEEKAKNVAGNVVERTSAEMALAKLKQEMEADIERERSRARNQSSGS